MHSISGLSVKAIHRQSSHESTKDCSARKGGVDGADDGRGRNGVEVGQEVLGLDDLFTASEEGDESID